MASKKNSLGLGWMKILFEGLFGSMEAIVEGMIANAKQSTADFVRRVARSIFVLFLAFLGSVFLLVGVARLLDGFTRIAGFGEVAVGLFVFIVSLLIHFFGQQEK